MSSMNLYFSCSLIDVGWYEALSQSTFLSNLFSFNILRDINVPPRCCCCSCWEDNKIFEKVTTASLGCTDVLCHPHVCSCPLHIAEATFWCQATVSLARTSFLYELKPSEFRNWLSGRRSAFLSSRYRLKQRTLSGNSG